MRPRSAWRAAALAWALTLCIVDYGLDRLRGPMTLERRAMWLTKASRRVLNCLGIRELVDGIPPTHGLVVANHLSYFDILILSAAMPCCFVAKKEIASWPFFGWAARAGGTIFLDRQSMRSAGYVADEIGRRLELPIPVMLFPEGTSTDGSGVLPFHPRLIDPAAVLGAPITAAAVRYVVGVGSEERELCYYGNASFLPHAFRVMGAKGFTAQLRFGEPHVYANRREAADETRAEVVAMREAGDLVAQ